MSHIVIKDLPDSIDLDRDAMLAVTGGARSGMHRPFAGRMVARDNRIVNFPKGFVSPSQTDAGKQAAGSKSRK
ncbi:hypothetical protein [Noviherbaspirillum cavernae]|nr:hypothetical protein [Noviherbaspirillum cavernae]